MRGMNLAEQAHVVNVLPAVDITGGKTGDVFSMKAHRHATILLSIGVSAAAFTKILVNACSDAAGSNPEAIAFDIYREETDAGDSFGARHAVDAAGYTPSANNNIMYCIEIDAAQLPDDKPYVQLQLTNGANSVIASAIAVLTGAGYVGSNTGQSVLA